MKIKQVEELVGISGKNIRFYEAQGLLTPRRADNGYREYHLEDVERLKQIKLLRKLGIPIEDILNLFQKKLSLQAALKKRIREVQTEREKLAGIEEFINAVLASDMAVTEDSLCANYNHWLEEMNRREKEGVDFVNISKIDIRMKRKLGAVIAGSCMVLLMLASAGFCIWASSMDPGMPLGALLLFCGIPVVIIVGVLLAIVARVKEINGGEEDEAAKY